MMAATELASRTWGIVAGEFPQLDRTVRAIRGDLEEGAEFPHLEKTVGADGKSYPATRPGSTLATPSGVVIAEQRHVELVDTDTGEIAETVPRKITGLLRDATEKGVVKRYPLPTRVFSGSPEMSTRAIAPAVGVSNKTVSLDRKHVLPDVTPEPPAPSGSTLTPATCMTQAVAYASQSREGYRSH